MASAFILSWRTAHDAHSRIYTACSTTATSPSLLYKWQRQFLLKTKEKVRAHYSLPGPAGHDHGHGIQRRLELFAQVWTGSGKTRAALLLAFSGWLSNRRHHPGCVLILTPSTLSQDNIKDYIGPRCHRGEEMYELLGLTALADRVELDSACIFGDDDIAPGALADVLLTQANLIVITLTHQKLCPEFYHTNGRLKAAMSTINSQRKVSAIIVDEGDYGTAMTTTWRGCLDQFTRPTVLFISATQPENHRLPPPYFKYMYSDAYKAGTTKKVKVCRLIPRNYRPHHNEFGRDWSTMDAIVKEGVRQFIRYRNAAGHYPHAQLHAIVCNSLLYRPKWQEQLR